MLILPRGISEKIAEASKEAHAHYPELQSTRIKIAPIDDSMQFMLSKYLLVSQPEKGFIFSAKEKRTYSIYFNDGEMALDRLPYELILGWMGHECAHIPQYQAMDNLKLSLFGIEYIIDRRFRFLVERSVDLSAIHHGMGEELYQSRILSLNNELIKDSTKHGFKTYYLSPEEIRTNIENGNL